MKVKQLIKELKTMPQNLEVEVAMHDNAEYESVGDVISLFHFTKSEFYDDEMDMESQRIFDDVRDECIIIRC